MRKISFFLFMIFTACFLFGGSEPVLDKKLDINSDDWTLNSTSRYDGGSLYGYMDGGAEVYIEYGFIDVKIYVYNNKDSEVKADIYRMTDSQASEGIFLTKYGYAINDKIKARLAFIDPQQIAFIQGQYFIIINASRNNTGSQELMLKLSSIILTELPTGESIDFSLLPTQDMVSGSARLLRGIIALQSIYPLGEGEMLWPGGIKPFVIAADYNTADKKQYNLILAGYNSDSDSALAFKSIKKDYDSYLELIKDKDDILILKDWNGEYIVIQQRGKLIAIYTRLPEAQKEEIISSIESKK
ncbi:MAG: hypothetical protein JW737_06455 [Acidobacteria bacterium]|nr:hypothetical protein [Acidobacteriota bacterium]